MFFFFLELGKYLLQLPLLTEWIEKGISNWEKSRALPSNAVQSFVLNLTALLSTNEIQFIKLDLLDVYHKIFNVFKISNHETTTSSVKFGYVKLLTSFLEHESGLKWIFKSERWKDMLHFTTNEYTIYVTRESQKFFLKLFTNCESSNEQYQYNCSLVLKEIVAPIQNVSFTQQITGQVVTLEIRDEEIQEMLFPILALLSTIIDSTFRGIGNIPQRKFISKLLMKQTDLDKSITSLFSLTCSHKCYVQLSNTLMQIYFAEINALNKDQITMELVKEFFAKVFAMVICIAKKHGISAYLNGVALAQIYFTKLFANDMIDQTLVVKKCGYQNQLIVIQIMPIMYLLGKLNKGHCDKFDKWDDISEMYISKIMKISCQDTIRLCYSLRSIFEQEGPGLFNIAIEGIRIIMEHRKDFDRERIVLVFQSLMCALTEIIGYLNENTLPSYYTNDSNGILTHILDALGKLVTDFEITWRESVETIRLQTLCVDLLKCTTLSCQLTVLALKLVQLSIKHFMPPNLALLVNELEDPSMCYIGSVLYQRLHDINWEVRDSTLEVIHEIVVISEFSKY